MKINYLFNGNKSKVLIFMCFFGSLTTMLTNEELIRVNRFIKEMPPLSVSVTRIMELAKDPKVDAKKLNDIISVDPVLTGKVLKLINSAYYSLPNQVTSLIRAIVMLGINTIKNLVISTGVLTTVNKQNNFEALNMEEFWRHSVCVGAMAKNLALKQKIDPKFVEEYFVAGLLHDIGKIPFNSVVSSAYEHAINYSRIKSIPLHNVETKNFEINHCDLGLRISDLWKLPPAIRSSILYHHNVESSEPEYMKFVATISLANIIANKVKIGFSGNSVYDPNEEQLMQIIKISSKDFDDIEMNAESTVKKAEVFLKLS